MKCIQTEQYVDLIQNSFYLRLMPVEEQVFRCIFSQEPVCGSESLFIDSSGFCPVPFSVEETKSSFRISTTDLLAEVQKGNGRVTWIRLSDGRCLLEEGKKELEKIDVTRYTTGDEAPIIQRVKTVDGERNFIQNLKQVADHKAYRGRLHFRWKPEEGIYGLGQAEEGIYNYRGHDQYLYQHNMRIPMPVFLSDQGYGMLFDCGSLMTFHDDIDGSYLFFDTISQMEYYFIGEHTADGMIRAIRSLTGRRCCRSGRLDISSLRSSIIRQKSWRMW